MPKAPKSKFWKFAQRHPEINLTLWSTVNEDYLKLTAQMALKKAKIILAQEPPDLTLLETHILLENGLSSYETRLALVAAITVLKEKAA